jgi:hypothetical protein
MIEEHHQDDQTSNQPIADSGLLLEEMNMPIVSKLCTIDTQKFTPSRNDKGTDTYAI